MECRKRRKVISMNYDSMTKSGIISNALVIAGWSIRFNMVLANDGMAL